MPKALYEKAKNNLVKKSGREKRTQKQMGVWTPKENPFRNDLIVRELAGYLNTPGMDSHERFQNLRLVSHLWNHIIAPKLQFASFIAASDGNDLSNLIQTFPATSKESKRVLRTNLRIIDSEWFEDNRFFYWISFYKSKLIRLNVEGIKVSRGNLINLLSQCSNLEEVTFMDLSLKHDPNEIKYFDTSLRFNFKRFTIIRELNLRVSDLDSDTEYLAKHVLLSMSTLESLKIYMQPGSANLIAFLAGVYPTRNNELFNDRLSNLKTLEFRSLFYPSAYDVLNHCGFLFTKLEELLVEVHSLESLLPFLQSLSNTLEKLVLIRVLGDNVLLPKMPKLKDFTYFYKDISGYDSPMELSLEAFISSFPALKSWSAGGFTSYSGPLTLAYGDCCTDAACDHVQRLLVTRADKSPRKYNLESLKFHCAITSGSIISQISCLFPNVKKLSLWIYSETLEDFFVTLRKLEQLEFVTIGLSERIIDFSLAVNSLLPHLLNLKEFTMEKVVQVCWSVHDWKLITLSHFDKIHLGLVQCKKLRMVSFKSLKINPKEVDSLRRKLLKSKPKLALNVDNYIKRSVSG